MKQKRKKSCQSQNKQLKTTSFLLLLAQIITHTNAGLIAGQNCFINCYGYCNTMGAGQFAGLLGNENVLLECNGLCNNLCAMPDATITGLCFSPNTTFSRGNNFIEMSAESMKKGDYINTLDSEGNITQVLVHTVVKVEGQFDFVGILLENSDGTISKTLIVTPEHGVIVLQANGKQIITKAFDVAIGDQMAGIDGTLFTIVEINSKITLNTKYIIQTETGTALASGILTTTHCLEHSIS